MNNWKKQFDKKWPSLTIWSEHGQADATRNIKDFISIVENASYKKGIVQGAVSQKPFIEHEAYERAAKVAEDRINNNDSFDDYKNDDDFSETRQYKIGGQRIEGNRVASEIAQAIRDLKEIDV